MKNYFLPTLLLLTLFFGELYNFFYKPGENSIHGYILKPELTEQLEWYIVDICVRVNCIIQYFVWYKREKKIGDKFWRWYLLGFMMFHFFDLIMYFLNHCHASKLYAMCYILMLFYAISGSIREYKKNKYY